MVDVVNMLLSACGFYFLMVTLSALGVGVKLFVSYWIDERVWVSDTVYRPVSETREVDALKVLRTPIGGGKAVNRYRYQAVFKSPENASSLGSVNGMLMTPINRKKNPHFNPKKLQFTDNVCIIDWGG